MIIHDDGASLGAPPPVRLVRPSMEHLHMYVDALERGWAPDNVRGAAAAREQLDEIARDPLAFLAAQHDPEGRGAPIALPDGSHAPRLPGYVRWILHAEDFCGTVGFRWAADGTSALPAHVLGHMGYAVVPWRRRRGYATAALRLLLSEARQRGLDAVELTTDPGNIASQRVILTNGGALAERFQKPAVYGGGEGLKFRIAL